MLARLGRNRREQRLSLQGQVVERSQAERILGFHTVRAIAYVAMAAVVAIAPLGLTMAERLIVVPVIALAGPGSFVIAIAAPRGRRDLAGNLFLGLLSMIVCAVLPVLWGGGIVVLTAVAIGSIPVETRGVALAQVGFFAVGMGAVGWARSVPQWALSAIALVVLAPAIERYYERWRLRQADTESQLADATQLIRHQADHDALTGLMTRSLFVSRLQAELDVADEANAVAVLIVDVDRFHEVNDILGHQVGDQLLVVLARRFESLPSTFAAARLGGDEFALALHGIDVSDAYSWAQDVVAATEELVQIDRLQLSVSATVGLAIGPLDGADAEALMLRADTAMYRAKDARQRVMSFRDTAGAVVGEHVQLGADLSNAITSGQIEVWFQPKVDLATERIIGAEALARWRHPDLGVLTPDRFLPLLGITKGYQAFTDEVIRQGIAFAARTDRDGAGVAVAINLAAMSFIDHGLPDRVLSMLEAASVDASQLTFEITESDILEDLAVNGPVFERITSLGIELSIDDFGVGYSSLSRLRELPVHELKIDRSFVARMESGPEDLIIVKAIVDLASVLGHRSVAEGIETVEAWDRLREMGCDQAQGYLFGRPMVADDFMARYAATDGIRRFVPDPSAFQGRTAES